MNRQIDPYRAIKAIEYIMLECWGSAAKVCIGHVDTNGELSVARGVIMHSNAGQQSRLAFEYRSDFTHKTEHDGSRMGHFLDGVLSSFTLMALTLPQDQLDKIDEVVNA